MTELISRLRDSVDSNDDANAMVRRLTGKRVTTPDRAPEPWSIGVLHEHLQWVVDVEHYTILYYMSAWFSIKDQAAEAARLIKSVVNQEMLHLQSAANLANAFGASVTIAPPLYGVPIPHLDFKLNKVDPTELFAPYSLEIGPFDVRRLNTMCIIEFPEWFEPADKKKFQAFAVAEPSESSDEYGSIGEIYAAIRRNLVANEDHLQPGRNQVDYFGGFYPSVAMTVTADGEDGLVQANGLIDLIVSQGEGQVVAPSDAQILESGDTHARPVSGLPSRFQNQADDMQPAFDHFDKFTYLRGQPFPETWQLRITDEAGKRAQVELLKSYDALREFMCAMFTGGAPPPGDTFGPVMFRLGAAITACWRLGALPVFSFSDPSTTKSAPSTTKDDQ